MNGDTTMAKRSLPLPGSWHTLSTNQRMTIHLGFLGAAVLFVHYRTFDWLLQSWWKDPNYSHGFLIPLISSYLVWIKRDDLAQLPRRPNLAMGGLLLLVSAILHLVGRAGGSVLFEAISLLILLPGIVLSIWGPGHLRALMLPLGYLQFMIPWTDEFLAQVSLPLQLLTARFGSLLLQAMGFSVLREATSLQLPHVAIEVAAQLQRYGLPLYDYRSWHPPRLPHATHMVEGGGCPRVWRSHHDSGQRCACGPCGGRGFLLR